MQLIVITSETLFDGEAETLCALFERGLQRLHLRKPHATAVETVGLLQSIEPQWHSRIVLHDHFQLAKQFNVGGIHLNRRQTVRPAVKTGQTVSRSCHTLDEITATDGYDYLFLSPLFDSLSKTGYRSAFSDSQLQKAQKEGIIGPKIIALGGITPGRIPQVAGWGFGGVAVIGALWGKDRTKLTTASLLARFNHLSSLCIQNQL